VLLSILVYAKWRNLKTGENAYGLGDRLLRLLLLLTTATVQSLGFPTLPAGLGQIFTYNEVTNSHQAGDSQIQPPFNPPGATEQAGDQEPTTSTSESSGAASEDLSGGVVVEVDSTGSDTGSSSTQAEHDEHSEENGDVGVGAGGSLAVAEQEEEGEVDGEEGHELSVGGWHAVAFAEHLCSFHVSAALNDLAKLSLTLRSLLLDQAFEDEVQTFTGHLSAKHQDHFHLSG
jgi:hypothetical protein